MRVARCGEVWPDCTCTLRMFGVLCLPAGRLLVWVQDRHLEREREKIDRQTERERVGRRRS